MTAEPDYETALALADAPRSLRNYVAPLQAENERLRAEVAEWKRVAAAQAELHSEAEDRADKLAEALRDAYRQVRELCDCYGHAYPEASFVRYEALLRNQEDRND